MSKIKYNKTLIIEDTKFNPSLDRMKTIGKADQPYKINGAIGFNFFDFDLKISNNKMQQATAPITKNNILNSSVFTEERVPVTITIMFRKITVTCLK